ncbi:MAG: MmgE/PrpD family protein [Hyphomicrobiaceae bacterium]
MTATRAQTPDLHPTRDLALWSSGVTHADISDTARTWARHAILDWFGVTIAGAREPLAAILAEEFAGGGNARATLVALKNTAAAHDAALVNGAVSHALDFDDVNRHMHGHPTVPVASAVLALGEVLGSSGRDIVLAFIAGYEVECRLGDMCGDAHYDKGFHATGTFGTFGAAAGAARLMGLDAEQTAAALGIAASQASGLKLNFGTMTKPLHAGKAAANGLIAARLAARGFTARHDAIEAPQGFAATQAPGFNAQPVRPDRNAPFAVEENLFKYHAACYLTHSSIEAIRDLRRQHNIGLDDLEAMTLHVDPGHLKVCNIPEPASGLEVKFSIRHLTGMALDGIDTAALETYSDASARDARYASARERIRIAPRIAPPEERHGAAVAIKLKDGSTVQAEANVGIPATDLIVQEEKLVAKFRALAEPVIGRDRAQSAEAMLLRLDTLPDVKELMRTVA